MHAHALPRRRVLVVDDDPQVRDILVLALDAEGFEVQAAEDGRRALELLAGRYPQYRGAPPEGPVIAIDVARWSAWDAATPGR